MRPHLHRLVWWATIILPARASFDWDTLLRTETPIIANGNVFRAPTTSDGDSCLYMISHTQIIRYCPPAVTPDGTSHTEDSYEDDEPLVLYNDPTARLRGAFSLPPLTSSTESEELRHRRLWILNSHASNRNVDLLEELDVVTGRIVQTLKIPGCADGHDAVRVGESAFIVDTRHGDILEIAIPPSKPLDDSSTVSDDYEYVDIGTLPEVTVIHTHHGFTRADHINNVAVHPRVLLVSVHGGGGIKGELTAGTKDGLSGGTRLGALLRSNVPENDGLEGKDVELTSEHGFTPIMGAGSMCHNIAFWHDAKFDTLKLITLDSDNGGLVSVVTSRPPNDNRGKEFERKVLWTPQPARVNTFLDPPDHAPHGSSYFSKGLAVIHDVAYFSVTHKTPTHLRRTIEHSLLVAVHLPSGRELYTKKIRSHGLISQILTGQYLDVKLRMPRITVVPHDKEAGGPKSINIQPPRKEEQEAHYMFSQQKRENAYLRSEDQVVATVTFNSAKRGIYDEEFQLMNGDSGQTQGCIDPLTNRTRQLPISVTNPEILSSLTSHDVHLMVTSVCRLDTKPLNDFLDELGPQAYLEERVHPDKTTNGLIGARDANLSKFKPGVETILLIFSTRDGHHIYHLPWMQNNHLNGQWKKILLKTILKPLGIPLKKVVRMQIAKMTPGSDIRPHSDRGEWMSHTHRVHIPLLTHELIHFLVGIGQRGAEEWIRIKSGRGNVYELNNGMTHAVRNLGGDRHHLIVDWSDEKRKSVTYMKVGEVCVYVGAVGMDCDGGPENRKGQEL